MVAVKLSWLTSELNRVSQSISIQYKMMHDLNQAVFRTNNFKMFPILDFSSFQLCCRTSFRCYTEWKKLDYLCKCKPEISDVCNAVEGHCLQAMKIVHHHANGSFDWLISGQQSVNPSREAISILSGKYKRFTFVHPVS